MAGGSLGAGLESFEYSNSRAEVAQAIDSIYKAYPEYQIPEKWKSRDTWDAKGFDFLDSRIFYFGSAPEEMYYVTFIGDEETANPFRTELSIRAVDFGRKDWVYVKNIPVDDHARIRERFKIEIDQKIRTILE
jgi:hypothetical protein